MIAGFGGQDQAEPCPSPLLLVIVPTFNERDNVPILFDRLAVVPRDIPWEIIVVDDDSQDGPWQWRRRKGGADPRLRCLRRVGRRGPAGARLAEGAVATPESGGIGR